MAQEEATLPKVKRGRGVRRVVLRAAMWLVIGFVLAIVSAWIVAGSVDVDGEIANAMRGRRGSLTVKTQRWHGDGWSVEQSTANLHSGEPGFDWPMGSEPPYADRIGNDGFSYHRQDFHDTWRSRGVRAQRWQLTYYSMQKYLLGSPSEYNLEPFDETVPKTAVAKSSEDILGYPFPSLMRYAYVGSVAGTPVTMPWTWYDTGVTINKPWRPAGSTATITLPVKPWWPGLLKNAAFWAGVFVVVVELPRAIRGRWRRKRGMCACCGYPRAGTEVCSECGR